MHDLNLENLIQLFTGIVNTINYSTAVELTDSAAKEEEKKMMSEYSQTAKSVRYNN